MRIIVKVCNQEAPSWMWIGWRWDNSRENVCYCSFKKKQKKLESHTKEGVQLNSEELRESKSKWFSKKLNPKMNVGRAVWPRFSESVFVAAQCKHMFEKVISCISTMWCRGWSLSTATVIWMTSASPHRGIQTVCGFTLDPNTSSKDKFP